MTTLGLPNVAANTIRHPVLLIMFGLSSGSPVLLQPSVMYCLVIVRMFVHTLTCVHFPVCVCVFVLLLLLLLIVLCLSSVYHVCVCVCVCGIHANNIKCLFKRLLPKTKLFKYSLQKEKKKIPVVDPVSRAVWARLKVFQPHRQFFATFVLLFLHHLVIFKVNACDTVNMIVVVATVYRLIQH